MQHEQHEARAAKKHGPHGFPLGKQISQGIFRCRTLSGRIDRIPPARGDRIILGLVAVSFAASYAASRLPWIGTMSSGTRIILLTVILAGVAAVLFPHPSEDMEEEESQ